MALAQQGLENVCGDFA